MSGAAYILKKDFPKKNTVKQHRSLLNFILLSWYASGLDQTHTTK